nr:MAG TPA: hypothetical protein [Caudoviricetes sp.]
MRPGFSLVAWFYRGLRFGVRPDFTAAVWWRFAA